MLNSISAASVRLVLAALLPVSAAACGAVRTIDPPATEGALAPRLAPAADGSALLTWLEPGSRATTRSLRFSKFEEGRWSTPVTIAEGMDFFANWADVPGAADSGKNRIHAHWLEMLGSPTYAYGARQAVSEDGGHTWESSGFLHDDTSLTEHGFVSYTSTPRGLRAFWLDGRRMVDGEGPMQLRTVLLDPRGETLPSEVLDSRVCECCPTDSTVVDGRSVVVYRDRSDEEVRDIALVRETEAGWSAPISISSDDWLIRGCPVNGPAIDAVGDTVAVAWFTAGDHRPRVQVAFSTDGGASFADPIVVDERFPVGRCDLQLDSSGRAWVLWMGRGGEIELQQVEPGGVRGSPRRIAQSSADRASGVPTMVRLGQRLLIVWRQGSTLRGSLVAR